MVCLLSVLEIDCCTALVSAFVLPPPAKASSQAIQQNSEEHPGELLAKCQFYATDAGALAAINAVRDRAKLLPLTSITKQQILHERRSEFAFEGDYWFDIQRQGFSTAQQIINAQERGTVNGDGSINHVGASFTSESQLFMPIPSDEVVADPELAKPPVPYYQ